MKRLLFTSVFTLITFSIIFSCSSDEDDSPPPSNIVQTPEPEPVVETPTATQYTLTVTTGDGGNVSTDGGTYDEGTEVTITATPDEGYEFIGWEGYSSNEQSITISMIENLNIEATFRELQQFTINIMAQNGGSVSSGGGQFFEGSELSITASASEGYVFSRWSSEDYDRPDININVTGNITLTAYFDALDFDSSTMDVIKYGAYTKDTISGKRVVKLDEFNLPYYNYIGTNIEESLDYIASENFIVYWDSSYDRREYAIDILRWSEFAAEKALESGCRKPVDYDTHRINILIFQNDEYGIDVFDKDFTQAAHYGSNGRRWISYPYYNNFTEINRAFSTMDVLHETYHIFQGTNNYLFDSRRWYVESTAEFFQSIYLADERINTLRHIGHYLQSTNLRIWKGYSSYTGELQHLYGLQLLFHYLDWEGHIDESYIAYSWNDSNENETPLQYLVRTIPNFRNIYFDFALKSTVIDFPYWTGLIKKSLDDLDNSNYWVTGERHFITSDGEDISDYEMNQVEAWGFSSVKINSQNTSRNISFSFNSDYQYKIGLIREKNGNYQYQEISNNEELSSQALETLYLVFVNDEDVYNGESTYPFQFSLVFD